MKSNEIKTLRLVGSRIRDRRLQQRLTQRALAKSAGISPRHLSAIECAERNASLVCLLHIARALRTTVAKLCEAVNDELANDKGST